MSTSTVKINKGIAKAITIAGSQQLLADALGYSQCTISKYLNGRKLVPLSVTLKLEKLFDVSRSLLRPDVFGRKVSKRSKPKTSQIEARS
jgi:DNA-binding transcriptional regulator YdaS (Cro superfamily)